MGLEKVFIPPMVWSPIRYTPLVTVPALPLTVVWSPVLMPDRLLAEISPLNIAPARPAFRLSAACCSVETGLSASEVLFTLPSPTWPAVRPVSAEPFPLAESLPLKTFQSAAVRYPSEPTPAGPSLAFMSAALSSPVLLPDKLLAEIFPLNIAPVRLAFKSRAVCCSVETGLSASEVLFTLPRFNCTAVMPVSSEPSPFADSLPLKIFQSMEVR